MRGTVSGFVCLLESIYLFKFKLKDFSSVHATSLWRGSHLGFVLNSHLKCQQEQLHISLVDCESTIEAKDLNPKLLG